MKMTVELKSWLSDNKDLSADASDPESIKAAAEALVDGSLTSDVFTELTADPDAEKATKLESQLDQILEAIGDQGKRIQAIEEKPADIKDQIEEVVAKVQEVAPVKIAESAPKAPGKIANAISQAESVSTDVGVKVNVIEAHKQYDSTCQDLYYPKDHAEGPPHPKAGQRAVGMHEASELERAVSGVFR